MPIFVSFQAGELWFMEKSSGFFLKIGTNFNERKENCSGEFTHV